jgi:hypothetical protein
MNAFSWVEFFVLVIAHFFLLYFAWQRFVTLPGQHYEPWFATLDEGVLVIPIMRHIRIQIQLQVHLEDQQEQQIPLSIPPVMRLGDLFSRFVIQRRKIDPAGIDLEDDRSIPYAWEFYILNYGGMVKRTLDPQKTLIENNLKEHNIIVVKRFHSSAI